MVVASIGLGSNLGQPREQIYTALGELNGLPQTQLLAQSSLYRSPPLGLPKGSPNVDSPNTGPSDQPDYINAVAMVETALSPLALLEALQALEHAHGRERSARWGPRTLDLDLLLYGDLMLHSETLTIPHPGLYERNFVLYPLAELAAEHAMDIAIPGERGLQELLENCPRGDLKKLTD